MRLADNGRAVHPKLRPSSLRHWPLDEVIVGPATDLARGAVASVFGGGTEPNVVRGPSGKARNFVTADSPALAETVIDAESRDVIEGDWTVGVWVRLRAEPSGTDTLLGYTGPAGDSTPTENFMMRVAMLSTRAPNMFWEHSSGTNVSSSATSYRLPLYKWTYLVWRKRDSTGPGPGGTCTLDLFVNGDLIETFGPLANTSDGSAAMWRLGHSSSSGGAPAEEPNADLWGAYCWAEALTEDEIAEDARRAYLLTLYGRIDLRVDIEGPDGLFNDMTDLEGVDWVDDVKTNEDVDNAVKTATVTLHREVEQLTLASLVTTSKLNLPDPNDPLTFDPLIRETRLIEIFGARVPLGIRAVSLDFMDNSIFRGPMDEPKEAGGDVVVVQCRDEGGILIDAFIEQTAVYGDPGGFAAEGEMQQVLDDNDNDAGNNSTQLFTFTARPGSYDPITLYTPNPPGWDVLTYKQRREGVLFALRTMAAQPGFECKYVYDQNPDERRWRLTFFEPDRFRADVDVVLLADDVLAVTKLQRSALAVRNVVRIVYRSSEFGTLPTLPSLPPGISGFNGWNDLDNEGGRMTAFVELTSDDSIAAFGRRWFCEIAEPSSGQIDRVIEATSMGLGILLDLHEPQLDKGLTLPLMFEMALMDMQKYAPHKKLFTAPQRLAVKTLEHSFGEQATTQVQLRGKPSVGYKRWLRLETRAGHGRPGVVNPEDALADTSQGTLLQTVRNVLDRTRYLAGGKFLQLRNGNIQAFSNGLEHPPDSWFMRAGAWKTDVTHDPAQISGGKSLRWVTSTGQLESDFVPVNGDFNVPYACEVVWQRTAVSSFYLRVDVEWYDASRVIIGASTYTLEPVSAPMPAFQIVDTSADKWFISRAEGIRPPLGDAARFMKVVIRPSLTGTFVPFLVDDIAVYRLARELNTFTVNQYTLSVGNPVDEWYPCRFTGAAYPATLLNRYDWGNNHFDSATPDGASTVTLTGESIGTARGSGFYAQEDGTYNVHATVTIASGSPSSGQHTALRLYKNATYNSSNYNTGGTGSIIVQSQALEFQIPAEFGNAAIIAAGSERAIIINVTHRVVLRRGDTLHVEFYRRDSMHNALGSATGDLMRFHVKQEIAQ